MGGVMLDLSSMKRVTVDPVERIVTVEPGVTLGELDRETQARGLATPTGVVSMTGLAGLALGGGLGWLNGKHGLACDNLASAQVVTATGDRLVADPAESPDLLWGLRGGGRNFGVVTSFRFRLHSVGPVLAGARAFPGGKAREALSRDHEFAQLSRRVEHRAVTVPARRRRAVSKRLGLPHRRVRERRGDAAGAARTWPGGRRDPTNVLRRAPVRRR